MISWSQAYDGTIVDYPIHLEVNTYPNKNHATSGELKRCCFYDSKLISILMCESFNKN